MQDLLDHMARRVLRHTDGMLWQTAIPRVGIGVIHPRAVPETTGCGSGICLVLQGAKQMLIGARLLRFSAGSCFASVVELPTTRITYELGDGRPYVATSLKLDSALLADFPLPAPDRAAPGFSLASVSREVVEAWDHHLALLDSPGDIPVLAAGRERELLYRLAQSPHGPLLAQIARDEGRIAQVRRAIERMRRGFDQPIAIQALADAAGMSLPSFNRHFRAATGTSPRQYQKTLRLQAARRLLAANMDAASAAFAVGYESPSQFSREYSRLFGRPPRQDASRLQAAIGAAGDILV